MTQATLRPVLAILAFAGSKESAHQAAFDALHDQLVYIVKDGNKRNLDDTLTALAAIKGKRARMVESCVMTAYTGAVASFETLKKTSPETALDRAGKLHLAAVAEFDRLTTEAAVARDEKTAARRASQAAAERKAKREAAQAETERKATTETTASLTTQPAPALTLELAIEFIRTLAASGDGAALDAVVALANDYTDATVIIDGAAITAPVEAAMH